MAPPPPPQVPPGPPQQPPLPPPQQPVIGGLPPVTPGAVVDPGLLRDVTQRLERIEAQLGHVMAALAKLTPKAPTQPEE